MACHFLAWTCVNHVQVVLIWVVTHVDAEVEARWATKVAWRHLLGRSGMDVVGTMFVCGIGQMLSIITYFCQILSHIFKAAVILTSTYCLIMGQRKKYVRIVVNHPTLNNQWYLHLLRPCSFTMAEIPPWISSRSRLGEFIPHTNPMVGLNPSFNPCISQS
jgi:hypothetical protein